MTRSFTGLDPARLAANVARAREEIAAAAARAGRRAEEVELVAVVKYVDVEELDALHAAGLRVLGENRADELASKATAPGGDRFEWHFIGQVQSRRVRTILPHAHLVHAVASDSAMTQLGRHGSPETQVLVEVNVAGEESKGGIAPGELPGLLERAPVRVVGLMTMPPLAARPQDNRAHFAALRELAAAHDLRELSMGTSQDFGVAVEEGATLVRLGTTLYEGA